MLFSLPLSAKSDDGAEQYSALYEQEFAQVNNSRIVEAQLREFIYQQKRARFYHGKPPEGEETSFQQEAGELLIERFLIAQAAKAEGLKSDSQAIERKLSAYDEQFKDSEQWQTARLKFLPLYRELLEVADLSAKYQDFIKDSVALSNAQIQDYYRNNLEQFTQPPQNHVAVILINVSPSAGGFVWQAVEEQANNIYDKLEAGANFAELAQLHSTDVTADQGGDMGYVHKGMIANKVEESLANINIGEFTKPIVLLEGVGIFKLVDRKPAIVHEFSEVEKRAGTLALNNARQNAWQSKLNQLKESAVITRNELKSGQG